MAYHHLSQTDRDRIEALLRSGHDQSEIAGILKVNKSTISREIRKRRRMDGRYDAWLASHKARLKRLCSKYQGMKIEGNDDLRKHIIQELNKGRSPDEIAGRLNRESGRCVVNHKAIYKWLYSIYGDRYCHLLCTKRHKTKHRNPDKQPRTMIPNLTSIHAMPRELIQNEGDTFVSPKRCQTTAGMAVVVNKASKLILVKKVPNLKPKVMVKTMREFNRRIQIKNIVLDRGIENQKHYQFEMDTYFCDPQSPHQKPLVEGSIGLMRRLFWKKGTDLSKVSWQEVKRNVDLLNNKYRKSLRYKSALEVAHELGILRGETNNQSCT